MRSTYKEDERPSLQWYPKDILTDFGFLSCSLAAQGLWMRMLWIMFFSDERGKLKANGKQIDNKRLAKIIGGDEGGNNTITIDMLIKELEDNNVFSRDETGIIYSRRMLRDVERDKALKEARSKAGKLGGRPSMKSKVKANEKQSESKVKANESSSTASAFAFKKKRLYVPDSKHLELAELLKEKMLENNPRAKITTADIKGWANDVRLMVTQDNRTMEEIRELIIWAQKDLFWRKNIRSTGKLRKQFDRLAEEADKVTKRGKIL